jgi:hypothetical protein
MTKFLLECIRTGLFIHTKIDLLRLLMLMRSLLHSADLAEPLHRVLQGTAETTTVGSSANPQYAVEINLGMKLAI